LKEMNARKKSTKSFTRKNFMLKSLLRKRASHIKGRKQKSFFSSRNNDFYQEVMDSEAASSFSNEVKPPQFEIDHDQIYQYLGSSKSIEKIIGKQNYIAKVDSPTGVDDQVRIYFFLKVIITFNTITH